MDDNARPHRSRAATAYLQSEAVTYVPWSATSPDLNPIEHIWDMLGRRIQAREPPVQNICQLEAALHREWQQPSQQDIRCLHPVLNFEQYMSSQVIHKRRFESEMTILSCLLNCEGQYLTWTCFTAKTDLPIL
jgi:hypothetical protein